MYLCKSLLEKLVLDLLRRVHLYFVVICSLMRAFANRRRRGTLNGCRMLISSSYVNFYRSERHWRERVGGLGNTEQGGRDNATGVRMLYREPAVTLRLYEGQHVMRGVVVDHGSPLREKRTFIDGCQSVE